MIVQSSGRRPREEDSAPATKLELSVSTLEPTTCAEILAPDSTARQGGREGQKSDKTLGTSSEHFVVLASEPGSEETKREEVSPFLSRSSSITLREETPFGWIWRVLKAKNLEITAFLTPKGSKRSHPYGPWSCGQHDDLDPIVEFAVEELEGEGEKRSQEIEKGGVYVRLNEVSEHRAFAKDSDVTTLRFLLLDIDPQGHQASAGSRRACRRVLWKCLKEIYAVAPRTRVVLVDSGSGYGAWIEHEARPGADVKARLLREGLLKALAARCDQQEAQVDTGTFSPNRLARVPGTWNFRAGRYSRVIRVIGDRPMTLAALEEIAGPCKPAPRTRTRSAGTARKAKRLPTVTPIADCEFEAIRRGCLPFRQIVERQESGESWQRETWRLCSGVVLPLGGQRQIEKLDRLAGGTGSAPEGLWSVQQPTTCRALAAQLLKDSAFPAELRSEVADCGTLNNPCGFSPQGSAEPSPSRHASYTTSPWSVDLREPHAVRAAMEEGIRSALGDVLLAGGCGSGKSMLMRAEMRTRRHLVAADSHMLCIEWEQDLRGIGVSDVVRIPKLEDACLLPDNDIRRARMKWHRAHGKGAARACKGCPRQEQCPYWKAREDAPKARIVIITHALLATGSWVRTCGSDRRLWIDENPLDALAPRYPYDAVRLKRVAREAEVPLADQDHEIGEPTDLGLLAAWLLRKVRAASGFAAIRAKDVPTELLPRKIGLEDEAAVELHRWARYVRSAQSSRPDENVALVDPRTGDKRGAVVTLCWRARVPKGMRVVVADATPDAEVLGKILERDLEQLGGPVIPSTKLIRYFDVQASTSAVGNPGAKRDRALAVLRALRGRHKNERLGIVTSKKLRKDLPSLNPPIQVEGAAHYGAARGSNELRKGGIDVGVVLKVPRISPEAVRAWAFFFVDGKLGDLSERATSRAYQERGSSYRAWTFAPGSVLSRADRALTQARLQQATGRFSGVPVVYVIADFPLGLGEELRCAAQDLRIPLRAVEQRGRTPKGLSKLVEVAEEFQLAGKKFNAAACAREALKHGWSGTVRTAQRRWPEVLRLLQT